MSLKDNLRVYVFLIATWLVLVVLQFIAHTYYPGNFLMFAVDSLAPIPVIVLVVVFLIGMFLDNREQKSRKNQLMFIKSHMFRLELRDLYIANFLALKSPSIDFAKVTAADLNELKRMRQAAETVVYQSSDAMEPVIMEYVETRDAWRSFMDIARDNGFDGIFQDMLHILHFVEDVRTFKELHPHKLFIDEAGKDPLLMDRVMSVLGDGIRKFLDYAIELKEKEPGLFGQVMTDYELSARTRS